VFESLEDRFENYQFDIVSWAHLFFSVLYGAAGPWFIFGGAAFPCPLCPRSRYCKLPALCSVAASFAADGCLGAFSK